MSRVNPSKFDEFLKDENKASLAQLPLWWEFSGLEQQLSQNREVQHKVKTCITDLRLRYCVVG